MTGVVIPALIVGGTSLVLSIMLLPLLTRLAPRLGLLDHPNERKRHRGIVPVVGGLAVVIAGCVALGIGLLFSPPLRHLSWSLLAGVVVMLIAGVADDRLALPPLLKAFLQLLAILLVVFLANVKIATLGGGDGTMLAPAVAGTFTVLCLLGYVNAINMVDGVNGLAGGMVAIALLFLTVMAALQGAVAAFLVALAFLLATLTFLPFNVCLPWRKHAAAFLGDAGSMTLGLIVGGLAVKLAGQPARGVVSPLAMAWILALPVMDTLVVITRRLLQRRSPFAADRMHLHHVLMDRGVSPGRTTLVLLVLTGAYGLYGLIGSLAGLSQWIFLTSFLGMLGLHALFVVLLARGWAMPGVERAVSSGEPAQ
jgi:UDP-GlcNAc:undecaprenyl-phosphate GlcNAc-1-phosphate transferase